ncbi:MAG: hypothetical protein V3V63_04900, partial [Candidatus Hydrothermarchaeaceae archaeon]
CVTKSNCLGEIRIGVGPSSGDGAPEVTLEEIISLVMEKVFFLWQALLRGDPFTEGPKILVCYQEVSSHTTTVLTILCSS